MAVFQSIYDWLQGTKVMKILKIRAREARGILMTGHYTKWTMELIEITEQKYQTNSSWSDTASHQVSQTVHWAPVHYGVGTVFIHFLLTITPSHETWELLIPAFK